MKDEVRRTKGLFTRSSLQNDSASYDTLPGAYPFTRGIHETMYQGRLWTMRQYAGFGTAKEANKRYHYLLKNGGTGISVAFDLPTQMGRDSDHPLAKGEVGRVGVAISTVEDMELLLHGIPLDKVSISMTINATASILLAFLLVVAERRKISWSALSGTVQNDVLKEYIARGTYIYPPHHGLRLSADLIAFAAQEVPQWNGVSISGYHIREAGSTAAQEIAFTLSNGIEYVKALVRRGLSVDSFAPRLAFFFNSHNGFLEEVAKFRAARRMWAKIMKEDFGAKNPRSMMLRFHTQTAGSSLTAQQPMNNVVRTSVQALSAVLGGTQSLHTNAYDEALGLPIEASALLALRTQQVLAYETGVDKYIDPFGGSYVVEGLTDTIKREALALIKKVSERGGMVAALEENFPQGLIEKASFEYQREVETQERKIVGVNCRKGGDSKVPVVTLGAKGEREQKKRIKAYKAKNAKKVRPVLGEVTSQAREGSNILPSIVDAARKGATLGEISDALREVFGEYSGN